MSKVSDFFRKARFDYLGAVDRDWIARTASYYNAKNPPKASMTESEIRARENILIGQFLVEDYQYAKNAYSISYLKSIPQSVVAGLAGPRRTEKTSVPGLVGGYVDVPPETDEEYYLKFQNEMGRIVSLALFSTLNSIDQSVWYEWLLRMDRGIENDRDMFLGVVDRGSVIDAATIATYAGAAAVFVATGAGLYAAAAAPSAAIGAAAEASTITAASGAAIEGGSLAGASGLLGETITVTGFAEAGAAATTVVESGGLFSGLGGLSGVLAGAEASLGAAAALSEGKKYVEGLLQPKKEVVVQTPQVVSEEQKTKNTQILFGGAALALIYLLSTL